MTGVQTCALRSEIVAVAEELEKYFPRIEVLWGKTGSRKTKAKERAELNARFQHGKIDGLVCQKKTGALGIDLFAAAQAVLYSTGFSYIDWEQIKSRLIRRGQTRHVDFFFLCATGTIDEDILTAIETKSTVSKIVLSRLKEKRNG